MGLTKLTGFNNCDIYCGEDIDGKTIRRKIWFFYSIPIWCKQYKIEAIWRN
jgi:hypothetical protein